VLECPSSKVSKFQNIVRPFYRKIYGKFLTNLWDVNNLGKFLLCSGGMVQWLSTRFQGVGLDAISSSEKNNPWLFKFPISIYTWLQLPYTVTQCVTGVHRAMVTPQLQLQSTFDQRSGVFLSLYCWKTSAMPDRLPVTQLNIHRILNSVSWPWRKYI